LRTNAVELRRRRPILRTGLLAEALEVTEECGPKRFDVRTNARLSHFAVAERAAEVLPKCGVVAVARQGHGGAKRQCKERGRAAC